MMPAQYNRKTSYSARIFLLVLFSIFFIFVSVTYAATPEFTPLVGLPGLDNLSKETTIPQYINQVYILVIVVGSLLGVMRLAWAGVKYSLSDVVTEKSDAKHAMTGVLMGLAILLIPFVVLKEINPDLVRLDVLREAQDIVPLPKGSPTDSPTSGGTQDLPAGTVINSVRDIGDITLREDRTLESTMGCHAAPKDALNCTNWCSKISQGKGVTFSKTEGRVKSYICRYHDDIKYPTHTRP